jgi:Fe-S-cluster containining protein
MRLKTYHNSSDSAPEGLCLQCGLCCNGVIFADVKLHTDDDPRLLESLGLEIQRPNSGARKPRFKQPCAALEGCRCRIYSERPHQCRHFECLLLKSVMAGRTSYAQALGTIRSARERVDLVERLLADLGDSDQQTALAVRFRRTAKRLEKAGFDETMSERYGRLTLAFHDLNLLLSQAFYA